MDWTGYLVRAVASRLGYDYRHDSTGAHFTPWPGRNDLQPLRFDSHREAVDWAKAQSASK